MLHEGEPIWYHGSPLRLTLLRAGSTITQDRRLAEVFSHKPPIVCVFDDGQIKHTGIVPGWLYRIDEEVEQTDVYPHPRTTMETGKEWLTSRPLRLALIGSVDITPEEQLSAEELCELQRNLGTTNQNLTGGQETT